MFQNQCDTFQLNDVRARGDAYSYYTPDWAADGKVRIHFLNKMEKKQKDLIIDAYESVGLKVKRARRGKADVFFISQGFDREYEENYDYFNKFDELNDTVEIDRDLYGIGAKGPEGNTYEQAAITQAVGKSLGLAMIPGSANTFDTIMARPDRPYLAGGGYAGFTDYDKANIACMLENLN